MIRASLTQWATWAPTQGIASGMPIQWLTWLKPLVPISPLTNVLHVPYCSRVLLSSLTKGYSTCPTYIQHCWLCQVRWKRVYSERTHWEEQINNRHFDSSAMLSFAVLELWLDHLVSTWCGYSVIAWNGCIMYQTRHIYLIRHTNVIQLNTPIVFYASGLGPTLIQHCQGMA